MPTEDREQQFERALARLLRDASPESHCPDAEIRSAYHERSLPEAEMARWKEHISQCVRCQEILTLVEQSEEVQAEEWVKQEEPAGLYAEKTAEFMSGAASATALQPAARPATAQAARRISEMRSRPRWRWLIPVGALAACAIVAVEIREIQMQNRREAAAMSVQMAKNQELTQQATAPLSVPSEQLAMPQRNQQQPQAQALDKTTRDQKRAVPAAPRVPPPSAALAPEDAMVATSPTNEPARAPRSEALPNSARMAAPVAPETSDRTAGEQDRNSETLKVPAPAPSTVAGAAKRAAPEEKSARPPAPQAGAVEVQGDTTTAETVSSPRALNNVLAASLLEAAAADHRYIVAPGLKSVWRVGDAGKIERSTDRGKTWRDQSSGVTTDLTAGSATSEKICWVIGKSGTILLSVDGGKSWKQVASPIAGDLGGIQARDALHASVWDVPKRVSYETSDGGGTWDRVANP